MNARFVIAAVLLTQLLALPLRAEPRQWSVTVTDPARPGRAVTADIMGPSGATAPCPVAVIGHATLTSCEHYRYLAEPLAEAGWLVVLPTTECGMPGDQEALALDMVVLARGLRDGSGAVPPDLPPASSGPYALLGHSLGGGAAVLAAAVDPDAGVLALLAPQERQRPSMIHQAPLVTVPVLIVAGELDCVTPPADHQWPLYAALGSSCKAISVLAGGGHCAFAGTPEPCTDAESACPPLLDPATQQALTASLVEPWLHWRLCGEADAGSRFLAAAGAPGVDTETTGLATAVIPTGFARLTPLGPNAAGGTARWALEMPAAAPVTAAIFDLQGRLVQRLLAATPGAGRHELVWNGRHRSGRTVAAGVYLLRVQIGRQVLRSRVVRLG